MQFHGLASVLLLVVPLLSVSCSAWQFFDYFGQPVLLTLLSSRDVKDNTVDTSWNSNIAHLYHPKENFNNRKRSGGPIHKWPYGIVPYTISSYFNEVEVKRIHKAMEEFHKYTCIRFKPYTREESDYVFIAANYKGCKSKLGRTGGKQLLKLEAPRCVDNKGIIIHELMHTIGFVHEQTRYDRDKYISVQWQNIEPGYEKNFFIEEDTRINSYGVGYDYYSILHYSVDTFSRNGQPTFIPKKRVVGTIGQRDGFSIKDIQKINWMYNCYY